MCSPTHDVQPRTLPAAVAVVAAPRVARVPTRAATPVPTSVVPAPAVRTAVDAPSTASRRPAVCALRKSLGARNVGTRSLILCASRCCFSSDSDKAEAAGWGAEDGKKELEAETLAEADAKAEVPASGAATPRVVEEEEEDNTQTYEEYLAAKANKKLNISELPGARPANEGEDLFANAKVVPKKGDEEEEWLFGAPVRSFRLEAGATFACD